MLIQTPDGSAGWASNSYLQANPGFLPPSLDPSSASATPSDSSNPGTASAASATNPDTITPDSHFGCNLDVCIDVEGHSTVVTSWTTSATGGNYSCWRPYYQVFQKTHKIGLIHDWPGPAICAGEGDGVFYDRQNKHAGYYPDGYELCNVWAWISGPDHASGQPCANIIA
jgi:hypothetical protein